MHASGEWIESSMTLPIGDGKGISTAQSMGSIITYLRRYSLSSILGVYADEDTDGDSAGKKIEKKAEPKTGQPNGERSELTPSALRSMIVKIADGNKTKPLPAELQHTPAAMEQILGGEGQRKELTHYLTGKTSFSPAKVDQYIGDGFVMALHRWLKPVYNMDSKSFTADAVAEREAHAAHIEALKDAGQQELI